MDLADDAGEVDGVVFRLDEYDIVLSRMSLFESEKIAAKEKLGVYGGAWQSMSLSLHTWQATKTKHNV